MSIFTYGCEVSVNKSTTLNAHLRTNTYVRTYEHTHMTENGKKEAANWHWQTGGGVWSAEKRNEDEDGRRNKETIELTKTVFLHINFHLQFPQTHTHAVYFCDLLLLRLPPSHSRSRHSAFFSVLHTEWFTLSVSFSLRLFSAHSLLSSIDNSLHFFSFIIIISISTFPSKANSPWTSKPSNNKRKRRLATHTTSVK